ncbi:hypothetical protein ANN_26012 [Periplaneta americana]|uniref:Reverse transcriptase domain-containing protein n=1 Tax=Periplaneta americana TaxID=6978 RepID=A0ABQ8S574_PERAM|nr:hypothetical protein ANN_26012 [Periplaneta americana]
MQPDRGHVARMGESRNAYRVLVGRPEGKRPLGMPRRKWEDNIKMDLREVRYDDRDWINLAQDRDQWRAYVRAAMNLRLLHEETARIHQDIEKLEADTMDMELEDEDVNVENIGGVKVGVRRIKCMRFADDIALLAEEESILRDMLLELNDSCEHYGMKISTNKIKTLIIARKIKKASRRFLMFAITFTVIAGAIATISSRIAVFSSSSVCDRCLQTYAFKWSQRKKSQGARSYRNLGQSQCNRISSSVALYWAKTRILRRSEEKRIEAFEMWIWKRMESVKWTDRIRNEVVLEREDEERMILKLIRKTKRNWLGHWLKINYLLKDALEGMIAYAIRLRLTEIFFTVASALTPDHECHLLPPIQCNRTNTAAPVPSVSIMYLTSEDVKMPKGKQSRQSDS